MITLYHLNQSRSKRIIWLLEELGVDYRVEAFERDPETFLAPESLKAIHPLGKSPVIRDGDLLLAESGAITEFLIDRYAAERLAPARGTEAYAEYLQWIHFAESSAMLPLLLRMFVQKEGAKTHFLEGYADNEALKVLGFLNQSLEGKRYLVEDKLSGADIMMYFVVAAVEASGALSMFPALQQYLQQLRTHAGCRKADLAD